MEKLWKKLKLCRWACPMEAEPIDLLLQSLKASSIEPTRLRKHVLLSHQSHLSEFIFFQMLFRYFLRYDVTSDLSPRPSSLATQRLASSESKATGASACPRVCKDIPLMDIARWMEGVGGATWALNGFDCLKLEVLKRK